MTDDSSKKTIEKKKTDHFFKLKMENFDFSTVRGDENGQF
jgi:hypothetical protein